SCSVSIVRLAAAASRAALQAVARRSATPTLDSAATHLVLAPTRKAGTKQLIGTISRRSPRLLGARSKQPFRRARRHADHGQPALREYRRRLEACRAGRGAGARASSLVRGDSCRVRRLCGSSQRRERVWLRAFSGGRSAVPRSGPVAIPRSRRFLPRGRTSPVPGLRAAGDDAARRYRLLPAV